MRLIFVLIALVLAVILAVQNATMVTLSLFAWQLQASLAVIIVLCFAIGAIIATIALMPGIYRHRNAERKLNAQLADLQRTTTTIPPDTTPAEPARPADDYPALPR